MYVPIFTGSIRNFTRKKYCLIKNVETMRRASGGELKLVTVLFRHGCRAPIKSSLYPKDPHINSDYFPVGDANLTNLGKKQLFEVGRYLRKRYDKFLGPEMLLDEVKMTTSERDRTKCSAILVGAGLAIPSKLQMWDPKQTWQPIPYTYTPYNEDRKLIGPLERDEHFQKLYSDLLKTDFVKNIEKKYENELEYLRQHTGYNKVTIDDVYKLYQTLTAQVGVGLKLPEWSSQVFPKKIAEIAPYQYFLETHTPQMIQLTGGPLAKEIHSHMTDKINILNFKPKMFLYSAHETTVAYQLRLLDVFEHHMPEYACFVIWELWKYDKEYGVKVFYENYKDKEPVQMKLHGSTNEYCPFDVYTRNVQKYFPLKC